jgi:2-dehydro-3-deoxyphosphogluconate aldolase / (4S)-4-hydroxy-2-oxoglutarate aldolase
MNKEKVVKSIIKQGFLPLYFHPDESTSIEVLKALYEAGIRVVEYTNRGKQALKNFRALAKESYTQFPDLILGLGTVLDSRTGGKAIQNGADFLVSPGYTREMSKFSENENILWIPGCMTPTEIIQIQNDGLNFVKIFPANSLGVEFLKSAKEVFPDIFFMPTGGINHNNMVSWFHAGASAVGIGNALISLSSMEKKEFQAISEKASALANQFAAIRQSE